MVCVVLLLIRSARENSFEELLDGRGGSGSGAGRRTVASAVMIASSRGGPTSFSFTPAFRLVVLFMTVFRVSGGPRAGAGTGAGAAAGAGAGSGAGAGAGAGSGAAAGAGLGAGGDREPEGERELRWL